MNSILETGSFHSQMLSIRKRDLQLIFILNHVPYHDTGLIQDPIGEEKVTGFQPYAGMTK